MKMKIYTILSYFLDKKRILLFFFILGNLFFSQTTITYGGNTTGSGNFTWVVPCDVTSITLEVWGAGGAGQRVNGTNTWGSGGSGGGFVKTTYTVVPGSTYNLFIGQGGLGSSGGDGQGSWFVNNTTVFAVGGKGAGVNTTNSGYGTFAAAPTSGNFGGTLISTYGGDGGNANIVGTGGGGSSAGDVPGNAAFGPAFGLAPANGYAGAAGLLGGGSTAGVNASASGTGFGAGGSGARTNSTTDQNGGNGGIGQIKITYTSAANFQTYCSKSYSTILPITNVTFAGINNTTSSTSTIANEYFCSAANVMQGQSYIISVKGNTGGSNTDYYRLYVDWNKNGIYGDVGNEIYDIGTINRSTGIDATVLNQSISVPLTATPGSTRMRVVKNRNSYTDACTGVTYGQSEDYTVVVSALPACTGTPVGGSAFANPTSGAPSSTFGAFVNGSSVASGLTYQWQSAPTSTGPWTNIGGATNATATITAVASNTTTYYRRIIYCGANFAYSTVTSYTTYTPPNYCVPSVPSGSENLDFIQKVSFLGTLNDVTNVSTWSTNPSGYQDFTYLPNKAIQAQNNGVNVYIEAPQETFFKAWVDWDKDGSFNNSNIALDANNNFTIGSGERVYNPGSSSVHTTTFGFVVPNNVAPGNYRVRVKGNYRTGGNSSFDSCDNFTNGGETEDYLLTVIENCPSVVISKLNGTRCGQGSVNLQATSSTSSPAVTEFRWYDSLTGGSLVATSAAVGSTTTWPTPVINANTIYYVTAYNGTCESLVRIPVEARVKVVPNVTFSTSNPNICGEKSVIGVTATAGNQLDYLIEEDFETTTSVSAPVGTSFTTQTLGSGSYSSTQWRYKPSVYVPTTADGYKTWFPAISSGVGGNRFVIANSDIGVNGVTINNALVSPTVDTRTYINLTFDFKMYYSRYNQDGVDPNTEFVEIEVGVSPDGITWTWTSIDHITTDVGIGGRFEKKTYNLSSYINNQYLRVRIRNYSGDWFDGVAVDDIELFGERPLVTSFNWTNNNPIQVYSDAAATIAYVANTPISTIYVKPNLSQIEAYEDWELSATANLTNGCSTTGDISIQNDTKVWNSASNDWKTLNWKPNPNKPNATHCIIVRTPVNLFTEDGIGKNLLVKNTGTLNVKANNTLTIVEDITNEASANSFVVESDANLIQNNDASINTGNISVRRNANLKLGDFNYWGAPVTGQILKTFSPNTSWNRFMTYNEADDYFYPVSSPTTTPFDVAKGYAIKADATYPSGVPQVFPGNFVGVPNNGIITTPINCTGCTSAIRGYNLISNPFPSNIDFNALYLGNTSLIYNTFYLWTNTHYNPQMQGNNYPGTGIINNYAVYNASGGLGPPYGFTGLGTNAPVSATPNQYIKVGQGFIIKAKVAGTLSFNNAMRTNNNTAVFFNKNNGKEFSKDRFWLSLKTPLDFVTPLLIAYVEGGTNNYELDYDAELLVEGSDSFYSLLNTQKLGIQGRNYPFNNTDMVTLGANFYQLGNYTISIDNKEGIFANGQAIYLKDKLLNKTVNLQDGSYTFTSNITGSVNDRFEIIYQSDSVLGASNSALESIKFYKSGDGYRIEANEKINKVKIYDASGKLIREYKPFEKVFNFKTQDLLNSTYYAEIFLSKEKVTRKFIK